MSRCLSHIGLSALVHDSLFAAFDRTLASKAEVARLKTLIADNLAQQNAAAAAGINGDDPAAFRVLKGKRILGARRSGHMALSSTKQ